MSLILILSIFFFFRDNVMEEIHSKLQEIRNPIHAIGVLIREMDYETDADMERGENSVLGLGEQPLSESSCRSSSSPYRGDFTFQLIP